LFSISTKGRFKARHSIALPGRTKERMHEHLWSVRASVGRANVDKTGVVMDFRRLKAALDGILSGLNSSTLNRLEYFQKNNASAELVAKYIYEKLEAKVPKGVFLRSVEVSEGKDCCAKFSRYPARPSVARKI